MTNKAVVAGAGGFIGHHLVSFLKARGYWVRGVDLCEPQYEPTEADDFQVGDLRDPGACGAATLGVDEVYQLAADMGGIGYISAYRAEVARNNVLINVHMLDAARQSGASKFFFSSSACVYPSYRQGTSEVEGLKEDDAYPAQPEEGYGWEKLFAEKLCQYYNDEMGLATRVARFHNVYGPLGTFQGGREKAPAAICRKVASARDGGEIEVWGDGGQTRSFMYVDDCLEGIFRVTQGEYDRPLNLGSDRMVTIDQLVDIVCSVAGKSLRKIHDPAGPQGVRGRSSDNSLVREVLGWAPTTTLGDGLEATYNWIRVQLEPEAVQLQPALNPDGRFVPNRALLLPAQDCP